jgi:hypothetical protein
MSFAPITSFSTPQSTRHHANDIALGEAWEGHRPPDRPVMPVVPRALGSPWTVWRPRRPCSSRPLDKVREAPGIGHMPHTGAILSRLRDETLGPLRALGRFASYRRGWDRALALPRCPIDLGDPNCPNGPKGGRCPSGLFALKSYAISGP